MIKTLRNWSTAHMPLLVVLTLAILLPGRLRAAVGDTFEVDGLKYTVTSESPNEVSVGQGATASTGELIIPSNVTNGDEEYTVTSIGYAAFYQCSEVTSVIIPDEVTSIGEHAFRDCPNMTNINIPDAVTSIGIYAFCDCLALTDINIPDTVTSIDEGTFFNCPSLTSINIPDAVTSIGTYAFYGCSSLTSININNTGAVTSIGDSAFYNCSALTSINIPDAVTSIGTAAFYNCSSLTSININNTGAVTSIGVNAFYGCSALTNINIPDAVTSIGSYAFYNCSALTSVIIPNSVTSIGDYAFQDCSGLIKSAYPSSLSNPFAYKKWVNGTLQDATYGIAVSYRAKGSYTFENNYIWSEDKTVLYFVPGDVEGEFTIPNSVTTIGSYAFTGCNGLTNVIIPNSVTTIDSYAFYDCSWLTSVIIPNSVTSIGNYAFYGCTGLTSVIIPNSVTSIGNCAFEGCSGLTSVIIPNSVTSIGNYAFGDCRGLKKSAYPSSSGRDPFPYGISVCYPAEGSYTYEDNYIWSEDKTGLYFVPIDVEGEFSIPNSVTTIGNGAFQGCSGLTNINIPNSVTTIGDSAFQDCSGLTNINIPNSVTTIGDSAFQDCSGLTNINIPNSVTSIGSSAFNGCSELTGVNLDNAKTSIGADAFKGCSNLTDLTNAESITTIGENAFYGCSNLTCDITLPAIESIGKNAFYNCSKLTSVIIGPSATSIGTDAFYGCSGLKKSAYPSSSGRNPFYFWDDIYHYGKYGTAVSYPEEGTYVDEAGYIWSEDKSALYFVPWNAEGAVIIPNSVTTIGESAFESCTNLTSVIIPTSVTSIGSNAFKDCYFWKSAYPSSLSNPFSYGTAICYPAEGTYISDDNYIWSEDNTGLYFVPVDVEGEFTIPASVTDIYSNAFRDCGLTAVNATSEVVPEMAEDAFYGLYSTCPLTVPENCFADYMATSNWYLFDNINGATALDNGNFIFRVNPSDATAMLIGPAKTMTEATILAKVNLDNTMYTVTGIGSNAFKNSGLTKVTFRNGLEVIGENAFYGNRLTEIELPESLKEIGSYAFAGNSGYLKTVALGSGIETIGDYAFYKDGLTEVTIPDAVKSIGNYAFASNSLQSATIGSGVETIGKYAFANNTALKAAALGAGIESIGDYAFYKDGLTEVAIPDAVKIIGDYAFAENPALRSATIGSGVETIGEYAFATNTALQSVTIGSGVETIGDYAFNGDALTEVEIPDAVKTIGDYAFASNTALQSATIGSGVETIGEYAFATNTSLQSVTIGSGVETIGNYAFNGDALTEVTIPDAVKTIGDYAFASNTALKSATIGRSVKTIGNCAFQKCRLPEVTIPANVDSIGASAFADNYLHTAIIAEGLDVIELGSSAFGSSVTNLTLGRNFNGTLPDATNITFGNLFTDLTEGFMMGKTGLKSVTFGTRLSEIPARAFKGCALTEVVIPSNIETIGANAFENNKLTNVIIGCGTESIGNNAFANNNSIAAINVTAVNPPVATDDVFSTQNAQLNVLKASREAYENALCWYQFEGTDLVPISVFEILQETIPANAPSRAAAAGTKQVQFTVSVQPADASLSDRIFWSSSNPEVATVDNNGLVTFTDATEGTADITAHTLYDGVVAKATVTAQGSVDSGVDGIYTDSSNGLTRPNDIYNLQGVCLKRNATQADIDALNPGLYIIAGKKVLVK